MTYVTPSADRRRLAIDHHDQRGEFAALWLRERSPDADTLDPRTGQRLVEAAELPLELNIHSADVVDGQLYLHFSDGHHTDFDLDTLFDDQAIDPPKRLWNANNAPRPVANFADALQNDTALSDMLESLHRDGFVIVSGVPEETDGMQPLIDRIGPLRRTNWGGIADVKSVADAYDLTMTQRGLEPHTDNPYRDPIPGYIWLHCLTNAAEGGDSTLVDGLMAAQLLRERAPDAYSCLTRVTPSFRYRDDDTDLESEGPLIELDSRGEPVRVRYNNRTERVPALPPEELEVYYAARQAFYQLITGEELTLHLKLDPGQMLIMDNYRLLHGRSAFQLAGGVRHMRQGYVDRDSTASRRRVLQQQLATPQPQGEPA
ncbi:2-trimethylaminoethylphosphonate dioxygenase [Vreelandella gomseomensis]|uniref:trimethyllysine dioxygenase n=1 Tax=Vreelandella gomseomensis TaxID=370766 RepID=A0ABU1GGM0_9GAMM|nr:TauD/TfdA family dioxygenase [Halomonas gomseomensis]MDR5876632.1 TauD/TfdA family dioxygenase [Halomonas gomseomensis]